MRDHARSIRCGGVGYDGPVRPAQATPGSAAFARFGRRVDCARRASVLQRERRVGSVDREDAPPQRLRLRNEQGEGVCPCDHAWRAPATSPSGLSTGVCAVLLRAHP